MIARPSSRGFTLLEVMIALMILAGALLTVSEITGGALRNHVRARQLDVATLLARGKMAELEDRYEAKGFRDFDESDEGTFEDDGHPEVHWKVDVKTPTVGLGPDQVLQALTGSDKGIQELLPGADQSPLVAQYQALLLASMQGLLTNLGEQLKKGVREVTLTVWWPEGASEASFSVVTHMVVLAPAEGQPR